MRQFNRILGFVAVSFVLAFMGKVNKVGLYTVYFKTLADVEIRNSTALDHGDVQYVTVGAAEEVQRLATAAGSAALPTADKLAFPAFAEVIPFYRNTSAAPSMGLRCFMEVAPRAPGA
jgi:hypothetical protein